MKNYRLAWSISLLVIACIMIASVICNFAGAAPPDTLTRIPDVLEDKEMKTMEFRNLLRERILEILDAWPVKDQYGIMFFIYPNEAYEYGEYYNISEFKMLYRCESDLEKERALLMFLGSEDEERWYPANWFGGNKEQSVISFDEPNPMADALISWYESTGVQNIGCEDEDDVYDEYMRYIGKGPNGLQELLHLAADIAAELQTTGVIEAKFGRRLPIIMGDLENTWYMIRATKDANPNGEADEYIEACIREGWVEREELQ